MRVYLASGWFSVEQERVRLEILKALKAMEFDVYNPKEDGLYTPELVSRKEVFDENIRQITNADFIIASTEGKDMGTIFECGCAYMLDKPIVYVWLHKGPLNLMLSESSTKVINSISSLYTFLIEVKNKGYAALLAETYEGEIE